MAQDDDERGVPCCALDAARRVSHIVVRGQEIGVSRLEDIFMKTKTAGLRGESAVRKELLRLAKGYNYVPPGIEKDYEDALYDEYMKREKQSK